MIVKRTLEAVALRLSYEERITFFTFLIIYLKVCDIMPSIDIEVITYP